MGHFFYSIFHFVPSLNQTILFSHAFSPCNGHRAFTYSDLCRKSICAERFAYHRRQSTNRRRLFSQRRSCNFQGSNILVPTFRRFVPTSNFYDVERARRKAGSRISEISNWNSKFKYVRSKFMFQRYGYTLYLLI